jgi:ABC-type multidrug transport system fused ATPase/permease subunit
MSRTVNDSDLIEQLIAHAIPDLLVNVLMLIGVTVVLVIMSCQLALLSMIPIPLFVLAMRGFAKYVRPAFRQRQVELGELNAALNDNLSGIREIKAFTREEIESANIWSRIVRYRDSLLRALRLMAVFHPFVEFASALGTIVLIYFGGRMVLNPTLPSPTSWPFPLSGAALPAGACAPACGRASSRPWPVPSVSPSCSTGAGRDRPPRCAGAARPGGGRALPARRGLSLRRGRPGAGGSASTSGQAA